MGPSPLTLLRDNTDVTVADTTSETALFTYTIPAYTLDGDRGLRVKINAHRENNSGGDVGYNLLVTLGSTVLWELAPGGFSTMVNASENEFVIEFDLVAKNSDSLQELFLTFIASVYSTASEDGTTDLDLTVTVEMDTADPAAVFTHRRSIVELL